MYIETPDFKVFKKNYQAGKTQFFSSEMIDDLITPVACYLKLAHNLDYSFLLESVGQGSQIGRYSIIGFDPDKIWKLIKGKAYTVNDKNQNEELSEDVIGSLRSFIDGNRANATESKLPAHAGAIYGYLGYNFISVIEPSVPDQLPDNLNLPDGCYFLPQNLIVFDRVKSNITLVRVVTAKKDVSAQKAWEESYKELEVMIGNLSANLPDLSYVDRNIEEMPEPDINPEKNIFLQKVKEAKKYITAGDIYQVVIGCSFNVKFDLPPFFLYRALRRTNPSPFMFFMQLDGFSLVGASPEIMVQLQGDKVTIRPLAGTRPRGANKKLDKELALELLADPKERAEHLMLLDLGRNDVGRVSKKNSVKVTKSFEIELYSHVMHISSTVTGVAREDSDAINVLIAGMPAGTVSGAPKVRAMQIVDELESERRGIYAGTLGFFGRDGGLDTCIMLRTAAYKDKRIYFKAAAGIVADSDPLSEFNEIKQKTRAIVVAAKEAIDLSNRNAEAKKRRHNS